MGKSASFTRTWIGLGLAAGLFLGCQQFLGQEDKQPAPAADVTSDPPEDVALKLTMKQTAECRALRDQVLAADAAGEATVTLQTDFIKNCIEEIKSADSAVKVAIPADLIPDDRTRCRWLVSEIEGGREELVIKFRYYCPDDCDTLRLVDSVRHARICRDPDPDCADLKARLALMDPMSPEYARLRLFLAEHCGARDTLLPPKDTVHSDCEILRKKISLMDTATEEYRRALRLFHESCVAHPPKDTVVAPTPCDSLRHLMSTLDPASPEHARLKQLFWERCVVKPPVDTLRPVPTLCDSLKRLLATVDTGSGEYDRILALLREKCGRPDTVVEPPLPSPCDSLKRRLASLDPASTEYAHILALLKERCPPDSGRPVPTYCDSLKLRLGGLDSASEEYHRILRILREKCSPHDTGVVKPPVLPATALLLCDSLRSHLASLDPASEAYARVKHDWYEACVDPKPMDPRYAEEYCSLLTARLKRMDPASPEYPFLKHEVANRCSDTRPVDPAPPVSLQRCDSLRLALSRLDPSTPAYAEAKHHWYQECIEPKPVNDPVICDHLMSRYKGMDTTSPEYHFLKHEASIRCPAWFPAVEPVKPADPVPVSPECADIQKRMSQAGLATEEYSRLKQLYSEKCMR